jgi:hypothetical protein
MFEHLDDPNPPLPRELLVELVVAEGARRRRRRTAVAGGVAATLLVLAGGVRLSQLGGSDGNLDVTTDQPDQPDISSPDSGGEGTGSGDGVSTSPGSTTPDSAPANGEASAPPGATTFAALTRDHLVVLGNADTGEVTRVLVDTSTDGSQLGDDVALTPDRGAVYFVATPAEGDHAGESSIFRIATEGAPTPTWITNGTSLAVSADGTHLAYVRDSTEIVLREIETGNEQRWAGSTGDESTIQDLAFNADGTALVFTAAPPEAASILYALDLTTLAAFASINDAQQLGPRPIDIDAGTSWSTPDTRATDGVISVVESCCALETRSYDGDSSFAFVDPASGQRSPGEPVPGGSGKVVAATYDSSGQTQLVLTVTDDGGTYSLFRRTDGQIESLDLAPQYTAVDW